MRTDEEIAELAGKGDKSAFTELVDRYITPIYRFCFRYVKTREDAEDVVQDVFLKIWKNLKKFNSKKKFKTWLFVIAKNSAIDWIKKKKPELFEDFKKEGDVEFVENIADSALLPVEVFEQKELKNTLSELIRTFTSEEQTIVFLYYEEELTFEEIALILGKPMNTVKSRHRRLLQKLRETLLDAPKRKSSSY